MFFKKRYLYIVTESLGPDLYNGIIRHKRKVSLKEIQTIIRDVVKSLLFLKKCGIVHCDLKPENILIKNETTLNIKIIDFGSASFLDGQDYDYLQTRPYRAPEIVFGCDFDFSADIWSLGCIIYEVMSSNVLFKYKTAQENFTKALAINNSVNFKFFTDGKKAKKYFGQNGLLTINESKVTEKGFIKTILPKEGIDFRSELINVFSSLELSDFTRKCLILDPAKRLKIEEAIEHPFLKLNLK